MGAIISMAKTLSSTLSFLSITFCIVSFILLMLLSYLATGTVFGTEIPDDTVILISSNGKITQKPPSVINSAFSLILLIFAWTVCLPVSIVSLIVFIVLKSMNIMSGNV